MNLIVKHRREIGTRAKDLILMRHAHAAAGSGDDLSWPLTSQGRLRAQAVAETLRNRVAAPDGVLTSPAVRAVETGRIVAQELEAAGNIVTLAELYTGAEEAYFRVLNLIPDEIGCALIVGHNPAIARLASRLRTSGEPLANFEPAGTACLRFSGQTWQEVGWGLGHCRWFLNPA